HHPHRRVYLRHLHPPGDAAAGAHPILRRRPHALRARPGVARSRLPRSHAVPRGRDRVQWPRRTEQGRPRRSGEAPDHRRAQTRGGSRRSGIQGCREGLRRLMFSMNEFGNNLYTGKTSFPFVAKRRLWFIIAILLVAGSVLVPFFRPVQFSIEFTGGSQFTVTSPSSTDQALATEAVQSIVAGASTKVVVVGDKDIRVQTDQMTQSETLAVGDALAEVYSVDPAEVNSSFIGPAWG